MIVCPSCQAQYEEAARYCGRCGSDMRRAPRPAESGDDPLIGRVVDRRYRIVSKLGQGGMGAVYQVEHLAMGKQAAMKLLHPALNQDPEIDARFHREAEAVSRLSHPNTVQVFDFGRDGGLIYLVMELVRGEDLATILLRDGPLPFARVRPLLLQLCDALAEAHEAGVVHRDLKPENLLLSRTRDGRELVKVLDFGLAKLRDREEANQVTARGSLVGTPYYMSPEQIRAEDLDGRSDIYSLGALVYRMTTGEHAFAGASAVAVLTQHLNDPLILPSVRRPDLKLDPLVDQIVKRAMAKPREERYPSVEALRQVLTDQAEPEHSRAPEPPDRRRESDLTAAPAEATPGGVELKREDLDAYERQLRRRRWIGALAVPLLLASGALGFVFFHLRSAPKPVEVEHEPNNSAAQANLIASDHIVRGHIGKCLAPEESDRDFYHFRVENAPAVLHVDLTGVPAMDLKLQVFDDRGQRIAESDDVGPGDGEDLPNVRLDQPGDYYLSVREVWVQGKPATEDERNGYTLIARWHALDAGEESEPNDAPGQALPLVLDQPMRGFAGRAADVDYYYPRGEGGGILSGSLSGVAGVDLRLVIFPPGATAGPPGPLPEGAQVFDRGGPGEGESFDGIRWKAGSAGPMLVVERKEPKSANRVALLGLDLPYSLTTRLTR